ncbi:hypothetical protein ACFP51_20280 [Streptomyces pratens]|uniref:HNH endonuclease n=1 Tax=Streptomyces pratens TaxID=887456 RepID=A0ABW1M9Z6_9ACTN
MSEKLRDIENELKAAEARSMANAANSAADRRAKAKQVDRFGVPLVLISVHDNLSGITNVDPHAGPELPLSLAPTAVKKALTAARTVAERLDKADETADRLFAEYRAVPAQVQRKITDAVARGEEPPSLSALADDRQAKLAGPLRDAIALRNALHAAAIKAAETADKARERHRVEWRDKVAAHIAAELPNVRKRLQDAANALAAILNEANNLTELRNACAVVDAEWLKSRAEACTINITPSQTQTDYDRATPDVYRSDRKAVKEHAANRFASAGGPVDLVSEAGKRVGWLGSYDEGGMFPNSLFVPLSSHEPV